MKTNLFTKVSIYFFSFMISTATFADDNYDDKKGTASTLSFFTSVTENRAIVKINNISVEKGAVLKVNTRKGRTIYTEKINGKEFYNQKYDFTQLVPGKYTLALESENNTINKHFTVGFDGIVRVYEEANFQNFKPIIFKKDGAINVCFENRTNRQVKVNLVNARGKVVYSESVEQHVKYGRSLNVSQLAKGKYTVEVFSGSDYNYIEEVYNM